MQKVKCKGKVQKGKCRVSAEKQVQTRNPLRTQTRSVVATTATLPHVFAPVVGNATTAGLPLRLLGPYSDCTMQRTRAYSRCDGLPFLSRGLCCEGRTCGRVFDTRGYHRLNCTRTGRTHWRHAHAMTRWYRVLEEAGYSVHAERSLRYDGLTDNSQRMDLVALPRVRGLGAQQLCTLHCDLVMGMRRRAVRMAAVRRCVRQSGDAVARGGGALMVLGCEIFGRLLYRAYANLFRRGSIFKEGVLIFVFLQK